LSGELCRLVTPFVCIWCGCCGGPRRSRSLAGWAARVAARRRGVPRGGGRPQLWFVLDVGCEVRAGDCAGGGGLGFGALALRRWGLGALCVAVAELGLPSVVCKSGFGASGF